MSNATSDSVLRTIPTTVEVRRDLEQTKQVLGEWLAGRIGDATGVSVVDLSRPRSSGASNENYIATIDIRSGNEVRRRKFVLRIRPNEFRLFLRENFDEQYRLITWLGAETDVPVPAIPFYEPDVSVLGEAFWLMEFVEGDVPPDNPPYHAGGFVFEATVEQRRKLWLSGLEAASRIPTADVSRLPGIVELRPGESGLEENLRHWTAAMEWACGGRPNPLLQHVNEWLWANKPARGDTALSWGDCRVGNMIFRNFECVAIIDWETITLAGPQLDLAHWLVMEDFFIEGFGLPRLAGIGGREETIAKWGELTGLCADQLDWHEVLASFRLTINMLRGLQQYAPEIAATMMFEDGGTIMSRELERIFAKVAGCRAV